jgi:hypothetical protein
MRRILVIAVLTGFGAAGILIYAFCRRLLRLSPSCVLTARWHSDACACAISRCGTLVATAAKAKGPNKEGMISQEKQAAAEV